MISGSKFVKGVKSNAPKKGYKITWEDGKIDNIFDESWLPLLDKAQKENRLVTYQTEKNDAGYWNIKSLVLAEIDSEPIFPEAPEDYPDKEVTSTATAVKSTAQKRDTGKNGAFSLSYAKDVACSCISSGQLKPTESKTFIITLASSFLDWLNGE
uniref:Uncharacterized protein n=1 Tax=viral metagenome TaxID=1070528 RepID=A0A6M3IF96_9ZZZZ